MSIVARPILTGAPDSESSAAAPAAEDMSSMGVVAPGRPPSKISVGVLGAGLPTGGGSAAAAPPLRPEARAEAASQEDEEGALPPKLRSEAEAIAEADSGTARRWRRPAAAATPLLRPAPTGNLGSAGPYPGDESKGDGSTGRCCQRSDDSGDA